MNLKVGRNTAKVECNGAGMDYIIREIKKSEYSLLDDFLYEAIFVPVGAVPPLKSIVVSDELQIYINGFGELKDDKGLVAEVDGTVVGAVWDLKLWMKMQKSISW